MLGAALVMAIALLSVHALMVALTRALETYSRNRLEDVSEAAGHPERLAEVSMDGARTERAAEDLTVLTGLILALVFAWALAVALPPEFRRAVAFGAVLVVAVVHLAAGAAGRVYAESLIDRVWPSTPVIRAAALPWFALGRGVEFLTSHRDGGGPTPPRPASVEVEIELPDSDEGASVDLDAELSEETRDRLERLVTLNRTIVAEVMTPLSALVSLPDSVLGADAVRAFLQSGRSRIPLYGDSRDNIVGVLYVKDLLAEIAEGKPLEAIRSRELARPAHSVPETKNAAALLDELRRKRVQIAIVIDEFGAVSGVVTLEDLLEEIIGPIDDEHDVPTPEDSIVRLSPGTYEVDGALPLDELNDRLDLALPTDEDYQTVGGLAFNALGRLPVAGDAFREHGIDFTILEVSEHSIRRLRLELERESARESAAG